MAAKEADLPAAVMWDMDGTLVDTEPYWIDAEYDLVAAHGGQWNDDLAHSVVGNPLLVTAEFMIANSPITLTPHEIVDHLLAAVVERVREHVPWRPGALELLDDLQRHQVPCALVTMSWTSLANAVLDNLAPETFAVVICGNDVEHGKPHPEPYLAAAAALDVAPADCIAIEDSGTGVRSAVAAGMPTIAVPHTVAVPQITGAKQIEGLVGLDTRRLGELARSVAVSA